MQQLNRIIVPPYKTNTGKLLHCAWENTENDKLPLLFLNSIFIAIVALALAQSD